MKRVFHSSVLMALFFAGCGDQPEAGVPSEVLLERATAFRYACAAAVVEETAAEDLDILEGMADYFQQSDTTASRGATANAAVQFARGYHQHAGLRASGYALLDSAVNYAATPADSIRYVERSRAYATRPPQEGTLERNVLESYQANLADILEDDNHRCNWDIPGM